MRDLSADELTSLRAFAEETMQDRCYILRRTRTYSSIGEPVEVYTADDTAIACGFRPTGQTQRIGAVVATTDVDATLRLPVGTSIDLSCRVKITERHLQDTTDETFEVASEPRRGPSGIVVDLRRLEL